MTNQCYSCANTCGAMCPNYKPRIPPYHCGQEMRLFKKHDDGIHTFECCVCGGFKNVKVGENSG